MHLSIYLQCLPRLLRYIFHEEGLISSIFQKKVALSPKEFRSFKLLNVEPVNHNTKLYRFSTNGDDVSVGLHVASCLVTRAVIDGKGCSATLLFSVVIFDCFDLLPDSRSYFSEVIRPYTPTSAENVTGHFDLVVKEYPQGLMSKHIAALKPGDSLEMKGPFPKVHDGILQTFLKNRLK